MTTVDILCSDSQHPVNAWLERWSSEVADRARVRILRRAGELARGDFLFLVSCHQIIRAPLRAGYRHTLVLHASDLPRWRGMSPHIWQILEGRPGFTVTLLDALDELDSGGIWQQREVMVESTALHDDINRALFDAEIELMNWALEHCDHRQPRPQSGEASYCRKRVPADSQIDPHRPLAEYFELLRVADPQRYPAYFEYRGQRYRIQIDKL